MMHITQSLTFWTLPIVHSILSTRKQIYFLEMFSNTYITLDKVQEPSDCVMHHHHSPLGSRKKQDHYRTKRGADNQATTRAPYSTQETI
jgi:hypothetical protein